MLFRMGLRTDGRSGVGNRLVAVVLTACWVAAGDKAVMAGTGSGYQQISSFQLPTGTDVFDVLGDGRIIALVDDAVFVETAALSRTFSSPGTLPAAPPITFPAFIRVSPSGAKFAVGDNTGLVGVFNTVTLAGGWFNAAHFEAEWFDDIHLALSGALGGSVSLLDTQSSDPLNPVNPIVIVNKGVPGGITFDTEGNLYTGNGFSDSGPIQTGDIKQFSRAAWMIAWTGGPPLSFVSDGILVVNVLSAASLGFDSVGNLHVGGGDFVGGGAEIDTVAVVQASALLDALQGMGPVDADDPGKVQRLDPDALDDFNFYSVTFNPATQELIVQSFGANTAFAFVNPDGIPAVSQWGLLTLSLLLTIGGTLLLRSKRCDSRVTMREG